MKKTTKVILSLSAIALATMGYAKHVHDHKHEVIEKALHNAKLQLDADEAITGSFIDTTHQIDSLTNEKVFVGAIMTAKKQFDFIASAVTGEILYFEESKADV
ncbi:hypothetical protein KG089_01160 [Carnobacteriaceae bacterium zg-ZUI252]|nr:hypothetical protein [Carnobacteriaceae bacterium zg-ZUI252]